MTQEFVTLPREVVEQALEALFMYKPMVTGVTFQHGLEAMQALRAALDQPQAEQPDMTPIAQRKLDSLLAEGYTISGYSIYHEQKHQHGFVTGAGLVGWWRPEGMEYPQPKVEQEPVANNWSVFNSGAEVARGLSLADAIDYLNYKDRLDRDWCAVCVIDKGNPLGALPPRQPQGGQEPAETFDEVWAAIDWDKWRMEPIRELVREIHSKTSPQPKRAPLTDEKIDAIADAMPGGLEGFMNEWGWRQFARAILKAAHNIK